MTTAVTIRNSFQLPHIWFIWLKNDFSKLWSEIKFAQNDFPSRLELCSNAKPTKLTNENLGEFVRSNLSSSSLIAKRRDFELWKIIKWRSNVKWLCAHALWCLFCRPGDFYYENKLDRSTFPTNFTPKTSSVRNFLSSPKRRPKSFLLFFFFFFKHRQVMQSIATRRLPLSGCRTTLIPNVLNLISKRFESLVIVDPATGSLNALTAAKQLGKPVDALLLGSDIGKARSLVSNADGIRKLFVIQHDSLAGLLPEVIAPVGKKKRVNQSINLSFN